LIGKREKKIEDIDEVVAEALAAEAPIVITEEDGLAEVSENSKE